MQNDVRTAAEQTLTLIGRSKATFTGVEDVDCFNEQVIVLRTPLGALTVAGDALNISELNLSDGRLVVDGEITSLEYSDSKKTPGRGFFGKLFG